MKKLLTISLILIAGLSFASCEKKEQVNQEQIDLNAFMDGSADGKIPEIEKTGEEAALESLENNEKTMSDKIDQLAAPVAGDTVATFKTSMGDIKIKLFPTATPKSFENFTGLAKKGYYDGTTFHRVIENFMVQGGDPTATGAGGESFFGGDFEDEPHVDLKNIRGALSMANRGPNTNGSQFFIVQAEATPWLDGYQNGERTCGKAGTSCHTVFGQVYEGMDIVDLIAAVATNPMDKPMEDVVVESIKVEIVK